MKNKQLLLIIIGVIVIVLVAVGIYFLVNKDANGTENYKGKVNSESKILVVYYSAQNHTKTVAGKIANNLNADIFEIIPEDVYTSDDLNYNDHSSRVYKEYEDESLRDIKLVSTEVPNWDDYDTILIGYPIWWGIAAWPVNNFVKNNDFEGKVVIPFCTSVSSSLGESGNLLEEIASGGEWLPGYRFNSNASDEDIKTLTDSLK